MLTPRRPGRHPSRRHGRWITLLFSHPRRQETPLGNGSRGFPRSCAKQYCVQAPCTRYAPYSVRRLCGSPPNWSCLRYLCACDRALAANLSTLPHCFAFIFPAFCSAGRAQLGTDTAHAVSESRVARKQGYAGSAQFKTFATKPNAISHHNRILGQ